MERRYLAVIGDPIEHSLSAVMHNAALERQRPGNVYLPFRVLKGQLREALIGFEALGFLGFNVTIPHKVEIMQYLDEISEEARLIGAVNTVHYEDGKWVGYNTDGIGFMQLLLREGGVNPGGLPALILGAGGAARAVAVQLGLAGAAEVIIANRTEEKAATLAREIQGKITGTPYRAISFTPAELSAAMSTAKIIINATPVGMSSYPDENLPVEARWFSAEQTVVDLIYRPLETNLLKTARSAGSKTVRGLGMLLYQGVRAYEIWFGIEPPIEEMRKALNNSLFGKS